MTDPITPPPELKQQWREQAPRHLIQGREDWVMDRASQWGADQRLEACCDWLREAKNHGYGYEFGAKLARKLRAALCPKPPSAVEQAKALIESHEDGWCPNPSQWNTIREGLAEGLRALEALPHD